MEINNYVNVVLKRKWLIILLSLIVAAITAVVSFYMIAPAYKSSATLYILDKSTDFSNPSYYYDIMAGNMLVKDFREFIKSRTVTKTVIEELDLKDITPSELAKKINIDLKKDTRILEITVNDESAIKAQQIADKVVKVFAEKVADIMKKDVINVIDAADIPDSPSTPRPLLSICTAFIAGLVITVYSVIVYEFINDMIKSSQDVEKYLGVSVLGVIPLLTIE